MTHLKVMSFVTERRFETADGLEGSTNLGRVSEASNNIIIIHKTSFRGVSTP